MTRNLRLRFWLELVLVTISAALVALAVAAPTWIEQLAGATGDNGSGEYEWFLALVPAAVAVLAGWQARREWSRALAVVRVSQR